MNQADEREVRRIAEEIAEQKIHKIFAKMDLLRGEGDYREPDYEALARPPHLLKRCDWWREKITLGALVALAGVLLMGFWKALPDIMTALKAKWWP